MGDKDNITRRKALKATAASGLTLTGVGVASANSKQKKNNDFHVREATSSEIDHVLSSDPFMDVTKKLPDSGEKLEQDRAKTVRKNKNSEDYKLAIPLSSTDSFNPVTSERGMHAYADPSTNDIQLVVRYGQEETYSAATENKGFQALASSCAYSNITPGFNCVGQYDNEEACTVIGAAAVLIPANDVTGIGVIDDVALPAVGVGAAGCAIEQAVELGIADWLNACSSDNWEWAIYRSTWWNPVPQEFLVIPACS